MKGRPDRRRAHMHLSGPARLVQHPGKILSIDVGCDLHAYLPRLFVNECYQGRLVHLA